MHELNKQSLPKTQRRLGFTEENARILRNNNSSQ